MLTLLLFLLLSAVCVIDHIVRLLCLIWSLAKWNRLSPDPLSHLLLISLARLPIDLLVIISAHLLLLNRESAVELVMLALLQIQSVVVDYINYYRVLDRVVVELTVHYQGFAIWQEH